MKPKDLLKLNFAPSILIYGPAGTGKTALISQAKNCYIFDFDNGMRTAATLKDKFFNLRQNVEFDTYVEETPTEPKQWIKVIEKLQLFATQSHAGTLKYDTIAIDSLTGAAKVIKLHVMKLSGDSMRVPQIQHWGMMITEMERMLTIIRSIKCLKLITAHEMIIENKDTLRFMPKSMTRPHSLNDLMWLFDEVIYTKVKDKGLSTDYIVTGKSTSQVKCRTRSGFNKDVIHNEIGLDGILKMFQYNYKKV